MDLGMDGGLNESVHRAPQDFYQAGSCVPTASGSHELPGFTRKWLFSFPPQIVPVLWLLKNSLQS